MSDNDRDTAKLSGLIRDSLDGNQPEPEPSLRSSILEHLEHSPPPLRRKSRAIYWWAGGLAALAASVLAIQNVGGFIKSRTAFRLSSGTDLVHETVVQTTREPQNAEEETAKPLYRTEVRTRQVPVTTMTTELKTRSVPMMKTRMETRTRQVTVDGETKNVEYQVSVPYTEQTAQSYTVQVPKTTYRTESYSVQVPVNETASRDGSDLLARVKTEIESKDSSRLRAEVKANTPVMPAKQLAVAEAEEKALNKLTTNAATPYYEVPAPTLSKRMATGGVRALAVVPGKPNQNLRFRYEKQDQPNYAFPGYAAEPNYASLNYPQQADGYLIKDAKTGKSYRPRIQPTPQESSTEQYDTIPENDFTTTVGQDALSTFSIDVDTASYSNARRFLNNGQLPPPNAVRIEEFLNYFSYDYPQPKDNEPFSVNMEVAECPWNPQNKLLRIGLKGKEVQQEDRPASNLVFLMDVSGSMRSSDKLSLMKQGLKMMHRQLRDDDFVSIVTYAGNAGVALEPTSGDQYQRIADVIDSLGAGGSTNGSAGIDRAYEMAVENFVKGGTNRVILATDGDLNVGITDDAALTKLIASKAGEGVFLTVLGFGTGNLKDAKMETLADNGNGHYAYIDSVREAHKVLVQQMSGSLVTIAKDVKLQLEFNPKQVKAYRQIGYENRALAAKDFDDDKKDAGEIGAGHTVTALYELVTSTELAEAPEKSAKPKKLKYQEATGDDNEAVDATTKLSDSADLDELLTLALRYKEPDKDTSKRLEYVCSDSDTPFAKASDDFQFASSVAAFAMLLRKSKHAGDATLESCKEIASGCLGDDNHGYRSEFVDLVRIAKELE